MRSREKQRIAEALYRERNREKIKERRREQYDPIKNRERAKKQKLVDPERFRARARKAQKKFRENHREELNAQARARYQLNKENEKQRRILYRLRYPEKIIAINRKNDARPERKLRKAEQERTEKRKAVRAAYRKLNPRTEYHRIHEIGYRDRRKQLHNEKKVNDPQYRLRRTLRARLKQAIKHNWKRTSAVTSLGCSIDELKLHLEKQWTSGMNWENFGRLNGSYNTWQIDHIKPLSSFDLTDPAQVAIACHYTNLAPLWAIDNRRKANKTMCREEVLYVP